MHSISDNIKFATDNNAYEVVKLFLDSFRSKYQDNLETSMKGSDLIFDSVEPMYYKCHKVNFKRVGSYFYSPDWIKNKKATINPKNEGDKCFQYAATIALNYEEIESHPEIVSNIKPFINKYDWEGINYPSKKDESKMFERNNPTIATNILYIKEKEILTAYISQHNSTREKQIILLMISNEEKEGWRYLPVKNLPALLRRITSKNNGDFCCLNCHSFRTENKLKSHEKLCKNKDLSGIIMPSEENKILEFDQYMKSDKMPYIIYADIDSLILKIDQKNLQQ